MNIGTIRSYGAARTKAADDEVFNTLREVHMSDELYFGKEGAEIPDTEHLEPDTGIIDAPEKPAKERQFADFSAIDNSDINGSVNLTPETTAAAAEAGSPSLTKYLATQVGKQVRVEFSAAGGLQNRSGKLQSAGADYIVIKQSDSTVAVCEISGVKIVTITE